ncbi:unnamed protein product [Boreogadus saida]
MAGHYENTGVGVSAEMDVAVQEVDIPSEDGTQTKYFLRVDWKGRDFGCGFNILLTDGQLAWKGEVTEDVLCSEAEELEMQKERYVQDLRQALTGTETSVTYNFTLTPHPTATTSCTTTTTLAYEKVQKDISFRLGSVELGAVAEPVEAVMELLELGVRRAGRLKRQNHRLQQENHSLGEEQKHMTAELRRYAEGKQALEVELFSRFVQVLNDKKAKLRTLQQTNTRSSEKPSKSAQSPGQASHQEEKFEDEYGGSTEEEEEEEDEGRGEEAAGPATATSASQDADSDSLLADAANDITDVAPCRKRRFRHLAAPSEPVANQAPPETTSRHKRRRDPPAGGSAAGPQKTLQQRQQKAPGPAGSPSTEDLFDDF